MTNVKENIAKAKGQIKETFRVTTTRPVAILMIVIGIAVFGFFSLDQLPLDLMPEISYPSLTVRTEYPGASPEDVENDVSERIEASLAVVDDLVNISSISKTGLSDVVLEFKWNTDMNTATSDVREKLDQVFLPPEAERPLILRYDPSLDPIIRVAFFATKNETNVSVDEMATRLRDFAENELREKLEAVEGVAAVRVRGGLERELLIELDKDAIRAKRIDPAFVINRVQAGNINVAGGNLREGETEYQVRVLNEYQDLDTIRNLIIDRRNGVEIRLGELARVYWHHKEREIYTRVDGEPSVELNIFKEADANIVAVAQRVRDRIFGDARQKSLARRIAEQAAQAKHGAKEGEKKSEQQQQRGRGRGGFRSPPKPTFLQYTVKDRNWDFRVLTDQSIFIRDSINEVASNAIVGGVLAVIILFLFLRSVKSTLLIGLTIPVSIIATFAPMNLFGVSLNIMSLGGLALGIGMLVDSAIVVLESIYRCIEDGDSLVEAVVRGTGEVGGAVIASTLTTIAVFFPIVFVEGVAGQIFGDMSLAVVFSLLASLMAALFFIPMLASRQVPEGSLEGRSLNIKKPLNSWLILKERFKGFWAKKRGIFGRILMVVTVIPFHLYIGIIFLIHLVGELVGRLFNLIIFLVLKLIRLLSWLFGTVLGWIIFPFTWTFGKIVDGINAVYPIAIRWALKNQVIILALALILAVHAGSLVVNLRAELIPEIHQGEFNVRIKAPVGTDIEKTNELTQKVESSIDNVMGTGEDRGFDTMATVVGAEKSSNTRSDEGENTSVVTIRLHEEENYQISEERSINSIREQLGGVPGITSVTFDRPVLFSFKTPIEVEIKGREAALLRQYSNEAVAAMQGIEGVTDVKNSVQPGNPELLITFDRDKLRLYDLDIRETANKVRDLVEGNIPTEYREADRQYDVRVRLQRADIKNRGDLENLVISPAGQKQIRLLDVANVQLREGPNEIRRIDQERTALISANTDGIDLKTATDRIDAAIGPITASWQPDYSFEITGQTEEMKTSSDSLQWAMALAIFLVYIVMASQFESLLQPFIIIFTIPLAMIGVVYMLEFSGTPVSIVVLIGAIMLAGIVVNNAIVLVDYINQLRERGMSKMEAIIEAGKARLRPILMTTMTTVLGLLPLALGLGAGTEIRAPMAWTVIAGLLSSTVLTLLVIPTMYAIVDRRKFDADQRDVTPQPAAAETD